MNLIPLIETLPQELLEYPNNVSILELMNEVYYNEFEALPNEMLNHLNSFLNYQDIRRFAQTSKHINEKSQYSIKGKRDQLKPLLYNVLNTPLGKDAKILLKRYLEKTQDFIIKFSHEMVSIERFYEKISEHHAPRAGDDRLFVFIPNLYFKTADQINMEIHKDACDMYDTGHMRFTCICGKQIHMVDSDRFGGYKGTVSRHFNEATHQFRLFAYNFTYLGETNELALPYGDALHYASNINDYIYPKGYLTLTV